ncbi:hypothetical protein SEUCBS139899_010012 [Sporothrix eucalyptigena]
MGHPDYTASPVAAANPSSTSTATDAGGSSSLFQCGSCKRQYKRLDHLARHVRSPGHEARNDAASTTSSRNSTGSSALSSVAANTGRVSRACQACSSNHLRCSEEKPCRRCTTKGFNCVWDRASDMVDLVMTPPATVVTATTEETGVDREETTQVQPPLPEDVDDTPLPVMPMTDLATPHPHLVPPPQMDHTPQSEAPQLDPPQSFMRMLSAFDFSYKAVGNTSTPMLQDATNPSNMYPSTGHGQWTPMGALDFDATAAGSLDLDLDHLDDMDFRFLDSYNTRVPFEFGVSPTTGDGLDLSTDTASAYRQAVSSSQGGHTTTPSGFSVAIGSGSEAFKRHYWKFRPNAQDHCGSEEHNLSLPSVGTAGAVDHTSPESTLSQSLRHSRSVRPDGVRLDTASRDKILMVVTHNCRRENVARVVTSFPSVELLDTLLQFYLMSPVAQAETFLHTASFHGNPNEKRPELLAAMTAAGAVLTGDPALSKLGFAIQECLRIAVPQQWERDNSLTRDLELGQAYLLTLDIGLWSGRSRKVEIAESFFMPLLTIRRRDGSFGRSARSLGNVIVSDDDTGDVLSDKWRAWIRHESMARFTFRLLQHDTNTSMALLTTPLISYAEVLLTFPESVELWTAPTPEQWKTLYLQHQSQRPPSGLPATLPAFLEGPDAFIATHKHRVDMRVVCSAFLSCVWGLTWEYVQLSVLQREMSSSASTETHSVSRAGVTGTSHRRWSALVMGTRQDDILQLIHTFREAVALSDLATHPVMTMRTELILMHTHTVLEQVQLFAGMEGQDQARAVHPVIVEWVASESARKSLWHAGQVLRGARQLARGLIGGPTAVMVYHAGLTLWIYGAVSQSVAPLPAGEDLFVDGPDTGLSLQRFFARGYGRPCIGGISTLDNDIVPLCQPDRVMGVVSGIFRRNHDKSSRPHMVESLIQLIDEIQRASMATLNEESK